ncbi:Gfo/Idh/MocA family oxidoreductase [Tritonibacter scottomollicae]|uniref:Gfo/Idh/MocA family oxidoreductase n=1 Tax=Tritonibacter scottomollicae TaxID=483013 RepID=A0ABZ0HLL7_TRISK|nr:Gfo/Idh/MocA family oxidoreductase [Tritonibacter scottomollicae]WOI35059.1 Gfo/Idh/MocA family oxidoreductase [Tritonibacter scottomollicae]
MTNPVRWGVLGAAKFAREHMAPAIHAAEGAELAALATSSAEKAVPFQSFAPGIMVHESYEALLADPSIDAVYIPLPNHLHVEWALKAMQAGKHVLVEKPATLQEAEFDQLIAARDAAGVLAAEAYMIVHHPQWQRVQELVQSGALGQLRHVSGRFSFDNRQDVDNIRNRPETGGGALRDIGVYVFGSARFVTGEEPVEVSAQIEWENGVDVLSNVQARFPGFLYTAYVSTRLQPYQEMLFHGDKGVLRLTAPFNPRVFGEARLELHQTSHAAGTGQVIAERFPLADHYKLQVEAFGRSLREGVPYACPLEFSRGTQAMMDRVFEVATDL